MPPKFTLASSRITKISFQLKKGADKVGYKDKRAVNLHINIDSSYNEESQLLLVKFTSTSKSRGIFKLDLVLEGLFSFDKTPKQQELDQFATINCPAILFPFLREAVADITRRAGLAPVHHPPINFVEVGMKKKGKEKGKGKNK